MIIRFNKYMINEMKTISKPWISFKLNNCDILLFYILVFDAPIQIRLNLINELDKVFDIDEYIYQYILGSSSIIEIEIYESIGNAGQTRTSINFERLGYGSANGPYIKIDKFLEIGIYGIEEYFEIQKNVDKYNL